MSDPHGMGGSTWDRVGGRTIWDGWVGSICEGRWADLTAYTFRSIILSR